MLNYFRQTTNSALSVRSTRRLTSCFYPDRTCFNLTYLFIPTVNISITVSFSDYTQDYSVYSTSTTYIASVLRPPAHCYLPLYSDHVLLPFELCLESLELFRCKDGPHSLALGRAPVFQRLARTAMLGRRPVFTAGIALFITVDWNTNTQLNHISGSMGWARSMFC